MHDGYHILHGLTGVLGDWQPGRGGVRLTDDDDHGRLWLSSAQQIWLNKSPRRHCFAAVACWGRIGSAAHAMTNKWQRIDAVMTFALQWPGITSKYRASCVSTWCCNAAWPADCLHINRPSDTASVGYELRRVDAAHDNPPSPQDKTPCTCKICKIKSWP